MRGPRPHTTTVVRQVWWKRRGVWLGASFVVQGTLALRSPFAPSWVAWAGYVLLGVGVVVLTTGWREGVEINDRGVEARRLARRENRVASWDEIERFDLRPAPVAVLHDGRTVTLFDWAGDAEVVLERLEAEREARLRARFR